MSFDGNNSSVEIPSSFSLPISCFTIAGKFKAQYNGSIPLLTQYNGVHTQGSDWNMLIATTSNHLGCQLNGPNGNVQLQAVSNIHDGNWHDFYVTYNHDYSNSSLNNFAIYLDGQLITSSTNTIGAVSYTHLTLPTKRIV